VTQGEVAWKARFRASQLVSVQIAERAQDRILALAHEQGDQALQLRGIDLSTDSSWPLTAEPDGQAWGYLWPDGRWVAFHLDDAGTEVGHLVRIPFEGGPATDLTPDLEPYPVLLCAVSLDGGTFAFGSADPEGSVLMVVDGASDEVVGRARAVFRTDRALAGLAITADAEIAVVSTDERSDALDLNLIAIDVATGERLGELWDGPGTSIVPLRCSPVPGDARTLAETNVSGSFRPFIWDPRTGIRTDLGTGDLRGDLWPLDWSPDLRRVPILQEDRATHRLFVADLVDGSVDLIADRGGAFGGDCRVSPDGSVLSLWQDATTPPHLIRITQTGDVTTVIRAADMPPGRPLRSETFRSTDGSEVQMWIGEPGRDRPFPLVLEAHGGPQGTVLDAFWPGTQMWLDNGFAFASVNFHGSTGFGREFERSIRGRPGDLEVQDIVAARAHLVASGVADPERVLLTGWSYGGFLTLLALGRSPAGWAGGMAGVAIVDWVGMWEDALDAMRPFILGLMGGSPTDVPERYARSSPIGYVEDVQAPILIVQGRNDTRCPPAPVERYEARARGLGKDIDVVWFGSGHTGAFTDTEQLIEHHEAMLRFALAAVGG
jgi:dipeptidyl aminopeptidase/acylaminoacyl peptidase